MNPKSIGNSETDEPQPNADDETVMIYQEYLLDPETKVQEVLQEGNVQVSCTYYDCKAILCSNFSHICLRFWILCGLNAEKPVLLLKKLQLQGHKHDLSPTSSDSVYYGIK